MASVAPGGRPQHEVLVAEVDTAVSGEWPVDPAYLQPRLEPALARAEEERGLVVVERRRSLGTALAALAILLILALAGALVWALARREDGTPAQTPRRPTVAEGSAVGPTVPRVVGQPLAAARQKLASRGLPVDIRRTPSPRARGTVLAQSPAVGTHLGQGGKVMLVVAEGAGVAPATRPVAAIAVPRVTSLSEQAATTALERAGFRAVTAKRPSTEATGTIVAQDPAAGAHVDRGTVVHLDVAVAAGPPKVLMPRLVGSKLAQAKSQLHDRGLRVTVEKLVSAQPASTVLGQSPVAGAQLRRGMTVTIRVAVAPARIDVPVVTGLDDTSARRQLSDAGFRVNVVDQPVTDTSEDGVVIDESPSGGSSAAKGSTVTITVGQTSS